MAKKIECLAMLLAGGQGSRLGILTKNIASPQFPTAENIELLTSPFPTALTRELKPLVFSPNISPLSLMTTSETAQPGT